MAGRLTRGSGLLFLEFRAERAFALVHVALVALGINEGIPGIVGPPRPSRLARRPIKAAGEQFALARWAAVPGR